MFPADPSVMSAEEPPLEERGCPMHTREYSFRRIATAQQDSPVVRVSEIGEAPIALQPIGDDDCARFHGFLHKRQQAFCRRVLYTVHSDSADCTTAHLRGDGHQRLVSDVSSATACLDTTDESLIHFDFTR